MTDKDAVVDSACRMIGVEGLRVLDASIFPMLMMAGTSIPVIMAAEESAAGLRDGGRTAGPHDAAAITEAPSRE